MEQAVEGLTPGDLSSRDSWVDVPEHMDRSDVAGEDLQQALKELRVVHRWFGGRRGTRAALRGQPEGLFLDVGCGAGDVTDCLDGTAPWRVILTDFNRQVCRVAASGRGSQHSVVQSDATSTCFSNESVDVVHCGLFLHHFSQADGARILRDLLRLARSALIVNDLHRHAIPYWSTRWGTRLLSSSRMVQHDAPLSVARGFRRRDLDDMAERAGFRWSSVRWVWPYRWVAIKHVRQPARA